MTHADKDVDVGGLRQYYAIVAAFFVLGILITAFGLSGIHYAAGVVVVCMGGAVVACSIAMVVAATRRGNGPTRLR